MTLTPEQEAHVRLMIATVLRHKADGTTPTPLAGTMLTVWDRWTEELCRMSEEACARLLSLHASDPKRRAFHKQWAEVCIAADVMRAKQDAGEWPPLTPEEAGIVVACLTGASCNGQHADEYDAAHVLRTARERMEAGTHV